MGGIDKLWRNLAPRRSALAAHDTLDRDVGLIAHIGVVEAAVQYQRCRIGDGVIRMPRRKRADGNDREVRRRDLAADDALQTHDNQRSKERWVDCILRARTVCGLAMQRDGDRVARRQNRPRRGHYRAQTTRQNMLAQAHVRGRDLVGQAVVDHIAGTGGDFLRRLEQCNKGAVPRIAAFVEDRAQSHQGGGVHVMATRMHHSIVLRGIGQAGGLLHRERIEIGAH